VDAQENPLPTIDAKKFYEVQKYIVLTGHITESLVTIVAGDTWKKLPSRPQGLLRRALGSLHARDQRHRPRPEQAGGRIPEARRERREGRPRAFIKAVQKAVDRPGRAWPKDSTTACRRSS
jgi:hypothetical protein